MGTAHYSLRRLSTFCSGLVLGVICGASTADSFSLQYPISVPFECVALAEREGVPTVIKNRYQAAKAWYKLYHLSKHDPLVHQCRTAVSRAKKELKEAKEHERTEIAHSQ